MLRVPWELERGRVNSSLVGFDPSAKISWALAPHCRPRPQFSHIPPSSCIFLVPWLFSSDVLVRDFLRQRSILLTRTSTRVKICLASSDVHDLPWSKWWESKEQTWNGNFQPSAWHQSHSMLCSAMPGPVCCTAWPNSGLLAAIQIRGEKKVALPLQSWFFRILEQIYNCPLAHTLSPAIEPSQRLTSR